MHLSSFTQYCVRHLLADHIEQVGGILNQTVDTHILGQLDIVKLLTVQRFEDLENRIRRLETLVSFYHEVQREAKANPANLIWIRHQILQVLGLQLPTTLSALSPRGIPEQSGVVFRFYQCQQVYEGLRYLTDLYGLVRQFKPTERLQAYQLAWVFAERGIPFVFTMSASRYAIWLPLRSPMYALFLQQGSHLLETLGTLHRSFCRIKHSVHNQPKSVPLHASPHIWSQAA